MTTAEKLARQIRRVSALRGALLALADGSLAPGECGTEIVDALLERACLAIGSGDDGRMHAVGLELEAVQ